MTYTVPGPRPLPVIGTAYTIDPGDLVASATKLVKQYGEIVRHDIPGHDPLYLVASERLVEELSDEDRFKKKVHDSIAAVQDFAGNGLFTAEQEDPEWDKAHRILMPAFNPTALEGMFEGMADIADQLLLKWSRTRSDVSVDLADEFTRLTLDTIALCSFSYRFNSFYSEDLHPFVQAMADGLHESGKRAHALEIQKKLNVLAQRRFDRDIEVMHDTVDRLIAERHKNPSPQGEEDILDVMISARDSETGEKLSDENLRYQLVTFLIAGHETTSGLLSFALYELIKNPKVLREAREAVDAAVGDRFPEYGDLRNLSFIDQILRETLRIYPPVPGYAVTPYETTTILADDPTGGVEIHPGDTMFILLNQVHRDKAVWEDPERFDPHRFDFDNARNISRSAWKPFGNGQRSCIGRAFAIQEAQLVLTLVLQHFDVELADPNYTLAMIDGLTMKPKDLKVQLKPRNDRPYPGRHALRNAQDAHPSVGVGGCPIPHQSKASNEGAAPTVEAEPNGHSVQILVGSNAGTSRNFAQRLANESVAHGFAMSVMDLDEGVDNLSTESPVLICTSSYEGLPTDNAKKFVAWLSENDSLDLAGVDYAVMGCGNSEWASTFQRIPTLIDARLAELGATRIVDRGVADVRGDYVGSFEQWAEGLWPAVAELTGVQLSEIDTSETVTVEHLDDGRTQVLRSETTGNYGMGVIESVEQLSTDIDGPLNHKFRAEVRLPEGVTYRAGDYLELLPRNSSALVDRVLGRFRIPGDRRIRLEGNSSFLPLGYPVSVAELLSSYVELNTPAARKHVLALAKATECPPERDTLFARAEDANYQSEIQDTRRSVLDLLEEFPSVQLPFEHFLAMLQPLAPRRFSISSSPERDNSLATITFSRVQGDAWSGRGTFTGVAGAYLSESGTGATLPVAVVEGPENFRPEIDVRRPMVLIGAGTGVAPLRGFVEDVALRAEAEGVTPGRSLLFYGCHGPESDELYREEFAGWSERGVVDVRTAYSRHPEDGLEGPINYVQHRVWQDRSEVGSLLDDGARIFVCGDASTLAPAVRETVTRILADKYDLSEELAIQRMEAMEREQFTYVSDVFS